MSDQKQRVTWLRTDRPPPMIRPSGADRSGEGHGEQFLHGPLENVITQGFELEHQERLCAGLIDRFTARRPAA